MPANDNTLVMFETRMRQLLFRFQELKKENGELSALLRKNEQTVKDIQQKLEQKQYDYESLKMAKMIEISDGNLVDAKERLSRLIRDVNKCIAILSDENE